MSALTGTRPLVRLALRRERVALPIWILWLGLFPVIAASAFEQLYPSETTLRTAVSAIAGNPSLTAFFGPVFDASIGGLTAWRVGNLGALAVGLMSVLTVIRHTRAEEEIGRAELVGATAVGRQALPASALTVTLGAGLLIAVAAGSALTVFGLPAPGSFALGLSFAASGWFFAALALLIAQLTESARTARGIALTLLAASFLVRIIADASPTLDWLIWLTPLGWAQRFVPFAGERWWVAGLAGIVALALVVAAFTLSARRDVGVGILVRRSGPARGALRLRSAPALAWRLQRGVWAGWAAGFAAFGAMIGAITPGLADLVVDSPQLQQIFERLGGESVIVDAFAAAMMGMYGLVAAAYAVQAVLRLRTEEVEIRADPILATAATRRKWMLSHVGVGVLGPVGLLVVAGVAAGVFYGFETGDVLGEVTRLVSAALVQLPAVWVLAGLSTCLVGLAPRFVQVGWIALAVFFVIMLFGALLQVDPWVLNASPFTHIPKLPGGELSTAPLLWLALVASLLVGAGLAGVQRRDIG